MTRVRWVYATCARLRKKSSQRRRSRADVDGMSGAFDGANLSGNPDNSVRAQSRRRCGRREPSPGADVAAVCASKCPALSICAHSASLCPMRSVARSARVFGRGGRARARHNRSAEGGARVGARRVCVSADVRVRELEDRPRRLLQKRCTRRSGPPHASVRGRVGGWVVACVRGCVRWETITGAGDRPRADGRKGAARCTQ